MFQRSIRGLIAITACAWATAYAAPDVAVLVTHSTVSVGADGVKRSTEFSERVQRRGDTVWVERVLPAGLLHDEASHADTAGHKHADLGSAARWIERNSSGKAQLRLVALHDQVVVNIAPTEFSTVGFDGSWAAAYHLIDPVVLNQLQHGAKQGSAQWYESAPPKGKVTLRILWDAQLQLPLQVHSRSADGLSSRRTTVQVLPKAFAEPKKLTARYSVKDYSDFLD